MHTRPLSPLGLAALTYAQEYGWPVFPLLARGKRPLTESGFLDATTHAEQVAAWWTEHPNANIGHPPGLFGHVVFDLDGDESEALARDMGLLDAPTLECVTGRGRHLYFDLPKGVIVGNVSTWDARGMNVRAHSGYVLLPPSIHPSGHVYAWRGELA